MIEPSTEAKQAAEWRLVGSGFTCILVDENNRTIATNLEEGYGKFIRDAHNTATAKAREELNKLTEIKRGYERMASTGVWVKTQKYAELAKLAHQQPNAEEEEYNKEAFVECERCQIIGYDLRTQKCVSCGYSR